VTAQAGLQWGFRFWDGTTAPTESRQAALVAAARFVPGAIEIVHRDTHDAPWTRDRHQPHTPDQRMDQLARHIDRLGRLNDWRGTRLVDLGEHPNPPRNTDETAA
jgi:hypothetical protein